MQKLHRAVYLGKTALDYLDQMGLKVFAAEIIPWLINRHYYIYTADAGRIPDIPLPSSDFRQEAAGIKDIESIMKLRPHFYRRDQILSRWEQGHICLLCKKGDQPVNIRWLFVGSHYLRYLNRTLQLDSDEFYADEGYTHPDFRGLGLHSAGMSLGARIMREKGKKWYMTMFTTWNPQTYLLAEKKGGFRRIGECGYKRTLRGKRFFWKGDIRETDHETISFTKNR